jgi:pimeloyl-ACP methyl ester carboxylesterase
MPKVRVNDIEMNYELHGEGEPLVLIMGLTGSLEGWRPLLPAFVGEYQALIFDNRGAGLTDKPVGPYSMPMMADDTAGLMDALGIDAASVYGMSMGGMIAQELALRHPQKVKALVLGCTTPGGPNSVPKPQKIVEELASIAKVSVEEGLEIVLRWLFTEEFIAANPQQVREITLNAFDLRIPRHAAQAQRAAIDAHDTYDRLPQIRAPTLVIAGGEDEFVPSANSPILAQRIPGAELVTYPKARHGYFYEVAAEATAAVLDFLRRQSEGKGMASTSSSRSSVTAP